MGRVRVRLRDIAEKTGFSANTVSLALRDSPRIPEHTRDIIRKAADDLNYLPNRIAQSLVTSQTMTVGLVLTDIRNPILTMVAGEVANKLVGEGYSTLFATSNASVESEKDVINTFRERQADGILIYPADRQNVSHLKRLRDAGYPLVSLAPDPTNSVDAVSVDEREGIRRIAASLIEQGCQKIAFLDSASALGNTAKLMGYRAALEEAGQSLDPAFEIPTVGYGIVDGFKKMQTLWQTGLRPDAVVAANDLLALGVLRFCRSARIDVPGDLKVAGFDDIEFARHAVIPLSSVCYPAQRIADAAVKRLLSLINHDETMPSPQQNLFAPDLALRTSTGATE